MDEFGEMQGHCFKVDFARFRISGAEVNLEVQGPAFNLESLTPNTAISCVNVHLLTVRRKAPPLGSASANDGYC